MQQALNHLRACDPVLASLIDQVGPYGIEFLEPDYETLVKAIVLQQLSGKVAKVIYQRLVDAASQARLRKSGDQEAATAPLNGRLRPEDVLRLTTRKLRAIGLSQRKIEYIRDLARRIRSGKLDLTALTCLPDEEVLAQLTALKGIGPWTVHMFLIFALQRLNVMPSGDLGIRAAVRKVYGLEAMSTPAEVDEMARRWHPYCTVASWYLWRSLEAQAGL